MVSAGLSLFSTYFDRIVVELDNEKKSILTDLAYVAIRPVAAWLLSDDKKYSFDEKKLLLIKHEIGENADILQYYYERYSDFDFREVKKKDDFGFVKGSGAFVKNEGKWKEAINKPSFDASKLVTDTTFFLFDIPADCPNNLKLNGFSSLSGRNLYAYSDRRFERVWRTIEHELAHNSCRYVPDEPVASSASFLSPFAPGGLGGSGKIQLRDDGMGGESNVPETTFEIPPYVEGGQLYERIFYGKDIGALPFCWDRPFGVREERF